jgi:nucleoside-diphosphate-sugar epimerase
MIPAEVVTTGRRVLVTGGAGFIGSHLCERLLAEGAEVIVLDDFSLGSRKNLASITGRIRLIEDSIAHVGRHVDELRGVRRVYHFAARISGYDSLAEPFSYVESNIEGLLHLLRACRKLEGVRIIFASSSTVYGNGSEPTRCEQDAAHPLTMYALSKYAGEHVLSMYQSLYGYEYVCLRLFNVYGPRQNPDHPYANVTCKFAQAAARQMPVKLYGDGKQTRDFVFVDDVIDAFMRVSNPTPERLYNVGTGQDASIEHMLHLVQELSGTKLTVERCPPWPNDTRAIRADVSLLERDTGFHARVPLAEGLRRTIEFFRHE